MSKKLLVLALLLFGIPAVGGGLSKMLRSSAESTWQQALQHAFPALGAAERSAIHLDDACKLPQAGDMKRLCELRSYDSALGSLSLAAATTAALWLVVVHLAGFLARYSRRMLLWFFVPGMHATTLVAVVMILACAAIVIGAVPLLILTYGGRWPVKILLFLPMVALGALAGVVAVLEASFSFVGVASSSVLGSAVSRTDAPELWSVVRSVSAAVGAKPPDHVVLGLAPSFFVTEAPVHTLHATLTGRTMFVSLPLSRILTVDEVKAILGHEMSHFVGLDTQFSKRFFPVYRGTSLALTGLAEVGAEGAQGLALFPAYAMLSMFFDAFAGAESKISRERELVADAGGARAVSGQVMATALVKVHAFASGWDATLDVAAKGLAERRAVRNVSMLYAELVQRSASPKHLAGITRTRVSHPVDSHPPLAARLESLRATPAAVSAPALEVAPARPAAAMIAGLTCIEEELSAAALAVLARERHIVVSDPAPRAAAAAS